MSRTRQMPCCWQAVESAIVRPTDFSPHLSELLKAQAFSTLIPSFLFSLVFSFTSSPAPQRQWATLIRQWHQHKHFKNKRVSRWTSTSRRYTPSAWEMGAPAVYSCSGIAIVFFSSTLHSFSIWMLYISECDGAKPPASTQTCTTLSAHHQLPTTQPASQENTWKLWFN